MSSMRPMPDDLRSNLVTTAQSSQAVEVVTSDLFLRHRIKIIEDLWEAVLRQECGQALVDLLNQLRHMCSPEGQATTFTGSEVLQLIEKLDLNEAIRAARAFALYFQLINIVEQHYEQRDQQLQYRAAREGQADTELIDAPIETDEEGAGRPEADFLERSLHEAASRREIGTFHWLFPRLKRLNVPPQQIQRLISQLDVWLVFTAHPTEIVRPTIRDKQRRIAKILRQLDTVEDSLKAMGLSSSWEADALRDQLTEEIRLWWRTDELHQFKPTVLDEVDHALHYFREVIFDAIPHLYSRFQQALHASFPEMRLPRRNFCQFGSWVGSDRDGNPSVTPQVTWQTACYQRKLVLEKYIQSVRNLIDLLSLSLHWSDVLPDLLESLEQDQQRMPDVYDRLAIRYRQEPYRLKLAYIQQRLENTLDRNQVLYGGDCFQELPEFDEATIYRTDADFLAELRLIQRNLAATELTCRDLDHLICQVEIFGFNLAHLDIRQESPRHAETMNEIVDYLQLLPKSYNELSEAERCEWLISELQTRRDRKSVV